jgi:O-acetyl-ADP-ribose deacetylase (regulator of RNase III)
MIEFLQGDILHAEVEALVNTVNCVGIMGRGIALQFRKEFPENYEYYKAVCGREALHPGKMLVFDLHQLQNPRYIINFPTKRHWKGKSRIEDIRAGLASLVKEVVQRKIGSIAIPPLGCGLGRLNWNEVRPLIQEAFRALPDVQILVYEPVGAPSANVMAKTKTVPSMTPGRAALLGLTRRYLAAVMDPFVSLLEIHKLMYFMQEAGEKLRLGFVKGHYGPYAEKLRHVLSHIEGHFISGYGDAEDNPEKQIELSAEASERAEAFLQSHPETRARFDRVVDLIQGFETPYGMELLATVHWVAKQEQAKSVEEAIARVYSWNERKRMFRESHVQIAWDVLKQQKWL